MGSEATVAETQARGLLGSYRRVPGVLAPMLVPVQNRIGAYSVTMGQRRGLA